jgi:5-methylcytosine-specific restriction enzyme subunit McrC
MVSYAFKRGINEVVLVYPNTNENINPSDKFEISSGFDSNNKIHVTALEIPVWSINDFDNLDNKPCGVPHRSASSL